jgi:hypothetical protein
MKMSAEIVIGALGVTVVFAVLMGVVTSSEAVSISNACLTGPSTATCFKPSTVIDPPNNGVPIPPIIVEVVDSNGALPGGTISLAMQANFGVATNFKIFYVAMNLDPLITPSALSFAIDGTSTQTAVTISKTIQDAQTAPPEQGFDLKFDFPSSNGGKFTGSEIIAWTVTCNAVTDADCASFGATSFNFLNTGADPDFRICTHIGGLVNDGSNKVCGAAVETTTAVPEPGTLMLLGSAAVGLIATARRRFGPKA